jgi:TRAP-type transport system small permease protein
MPIFNKIFGVFERLNRYLFFAGSFLIFFLASLTIIDVTGRYFFNSPLLGSLEMSELTMSTIVFLCFGYSFSLGAHIHVDLVIGKLPSRIASIIGRISSLMVLFFLVILAWQATRIALEQSQKITDILEIPVYPFAMLVPFGAGMACLSIIGHFISSLKSNTPEETSELQPGEEGF